MKIRNADLGDLSVVRDAVNGLGRELDGIAYADELYRAHTEHSSEVEEIYKQRHERLHVIREEVATLTLVIQTAEGQRLSSEAMSNRTEQAIHEETIPDKAEVTLTGTVQHVEEPPLSRPKWESRDCLRPR